MLESPSTLIGNFQSLDERVDPDGIRSQRIIQRMEKVLHPDVSAFFIKALSDPRTPEMARLEILQCLDHAAVTDAAHYQALGDLLLALIQSTDNSLLRDYAMITSTNFSNLDELSTAVLSILVDPDEDLDTRWNSFSILRSLGDTLRTRAIASQLSRDEEFQQLVSGLVDEWQSAT